MDNFTYSGYCQPDRNMIELAFLDDWRLELYFYKANTTFLFNHVVLYYKLSGPLFPYSIHNGAQSEVYDFVFINSTITNHSYACNTGIRIDLGEVIIYLKNLRVQPFFDKRPNLPFDPELFCSGDIIPEPAADLSNPTFLIIFAVLVAFVSLCCLLFVCLHLRNSQQRKPKTFSNKKRTDSLDSSLIKEPKEPTQTKHKKVLRSKSSPAKSSNVIDENSPILQTSHSNEIENKTKKEIKTKAQVSWHPNTGINEDEERLNLAAESKRTIARV